MSETRLIVILAAGKGTRMGTGRSKVLHEIAHRTLLEHVMHAAQGIANSRRAVVVGPDAADIEDLVASVDPDATIHVQAERLGTGHAVGSARSAFDGARSVLVVFGDTPLIATETLIRMQDALDAGAKVAVLGFRPDDPTGYGRLITNGEALVAIREHKDASEAERRVTLCNGGAMAFAADALPTILDRLTNENASGEYYLTDAVEIARADGHRVTVVEGDVADAVGVNTPADLAAAEALMQVRLRATALAKGVMMQAPDTVHFAADTEIGQGATIEPYVVFGPGVRVAGGANIRAFSHLEGADVGEGAQIGPYARLRPGAELAAKAKAGNFVEIKSARVGEGAKINHLTYIGDAEIGAGANIGAGTITCNYDGFLKHRTEIGAEAFIGSNSALVAPVTIGEGAYVGSGSVVTENVPPDALAIARARQELKPGRAKSIRERLAAAKAQLKG